MSDAPGDDAFETITSRASAREADQARRFVQDTQALPGAAAAAKRRAPPWQQAPANTKPRADGTLVKALARAWRWQRRIESGRAKSITDLAEQRGDNRLRLTAPAADLPGAGHRRGDPRRTAAERAEAGGGAAERAACKERPGHGPARERRATAVIQCCRRFRRICGPEQRVDEIARRVAVVGCGRRGSDHGSTAGNIGGSLNTGADHLHHTSPGDRRQGRASA